MVTGHVKVIMVIISKRSNVMLKKKKKLTF